MPFIEQQLSADGVASEGRVVANKAILDIITNTHVLTMAVNAGGTGYVVNDTFRLNTGTPVVVNGDSFHAVGRVTAEAAGVVTAVEITSAGAYPSGTQPTASGGATTTLTGAGSGLTIDTTMQAAYWTQDSSTYTDLLTLFDWICTSTKAANPPTIGGSSQLSGVNDGIRFMTATSYSGILPWASQPGSPPTNTFYVGCPNQDPKVYISTTERRVNVMITDGTNIQYAGMGLFIPFVDVDSNYPFPAICHAQATSTPAFSAIWNESTNAGVVHPINFSGLGCYQYRNNLSTEWFGITKENNNGTQVARGMIWPNYSDDAEFEFNFAPVPTGSGAGTGDMNPFTSTQLAGSFMDEDTQGWFLSSASTVQPQGPAPLGIGSQLHFTVQAHIIANLPNNAELIGIIDGYEALHGRGLNNFDEIQNQDGRRYIVFDDTLSGTRFRWVAMEMS